MNNGVRNMFARFWDRWDSITAK